MPTIKISQEVYDYLTDKMSKRETDDDVLRRVLPGFGNGQPSEPVKRYFKQRQATVQIIARIEGEELVVRCPENRKEFREKLPSDKRDRVAIHRLRKQAFDWNGQQGGTKGQENHISKCLSTAGYYIRPQGHDYE